jgi:hypothetical protein
VMVCAFWRYWFESRMEYNVFFFEHFCVFNSIFKCINAAFFPNFGLVTNLTIFIIHSMQSNLDSSDNAASIQSRLHRNWPCFQSWLLLDAYDLQRGAEYRDCYLWSWLCSYESCFVFKRSHISFSCWRQAFLRFSMNFFCPWDESTIQNRSSIRQGTWCLYCCLEFII